MSNSAFNRTTGLLLVATAMVSLAACTSTVSRGVNDQGKAEEIIFPKLDDSYGLNKEGIFPNVQNMRKIGIGVTKDDLQYLIGSPHFSEMTGAREWDYIMKFREQINGAVTICQYKVIFDKNMKGQSFYWLPADCARFIGDKPAPVALATPTVFHLKGDALFRFGKYELNDLLPGGRAELDRVASQIKAEGANARMTVTVVGHADRLGSVAGNQRLSHGRAEAVRAYLVQQGIAADHIHARGAGSTQPVVQCSNKNRAALVECLQPNRRVDIEVTGTR